MSLRDQLSQLVYSTDQGRIETEKQPTATPSSDGFVKMRRETKGRKGKGVTCLEGFGLDTKELATLAKAMKKRCGVGGSVKGFVVEIQGDQRDTLQDWLQEQGYKVKRVGG
ncbi:stress response translation initiation inhibitor YciH [Alginatibacterium sediminis]|uniref:Stress response translation initiation inhibitor YciH n=1 Tax=Alginatibacterium sediminis TaxID=2164068 RepID=A0A420EGJ6_9ALTE|nr:stress response translation initiation inhibitor YciH [Alginatibacterium sediminis]RKF19832.1 stress response translation initiation inhibitor YciH [Alginatibacterium sediminis]